MRSKKASEIIHIQAKILPVMKDKKKEIINKKRKHRIRQKRSAKLIWGK